VRILLVKRFSIATFGLTLAGVLLFPAAAPAEDEDGPRVEVGGVLDGRAVSTDRTASWLDGGLGKARYGPPVVAERATLFRLSQLSLLVDAPVGDLLSAHVQLNAEADGDREQQRSHVDVIEAFADVRFEPSARTRLRARLGVFFPPVSQEADEPGWTGPYTITPSASTSWIADELRTIGAEARAALRPEGHELALAVAAFGGNDPVGSLLSWRGWAVGDRQTGLSDRLPLAPIPAIEPGGVFDFAPRWVQPFREIDGRLGFYAAASYKKAGAVDVRVIHYDNLAQETVFDGFQYAWDTRFDAASLRVTVGRLELLGHYLSGRTKMGRAADGRAKVDNDFRTAFGMVSLVAGRHRMSARYETLEVEDADFLQAEDPNGEDGHAWTAAYALRIGGSHRFALEVLRVDSERDVRAALGLPVRATETLAQASFRLRF
jgi:hypothetical protein